MRTIRQNEARISARNSSRILNAKKVGSSIGEDRSEGVADTQIIVRYKIVLRVRSIEGMRREIFFPKTNSTLDKPEPKI